MNSKIRRIRELDMNELVNIEYGLRYKRLAELYCKIFEWKAVKCVVVVREHFYRATVENECKTKDELKIISGTTSSFYLRKSTAIEKAFQEWFEKVFDYIGLKKTAFTELKHIMSNLNKKDEEEDEILEIPVEVVSLMAYKIYCKRCKKSLSALEKYNHKCETNQQLMQVQCALCYRHMYFSTYIEHVDRCRSLKRIECKICEEDVSYEELSQHQKICTINQPKCQICFVNYKRQDQMVVLDCTHLVHNECVMDKKECYICDKKIKFPIMNATF